MCLLYYISQKRAKISTYKGSFKYIWKGICLLRINKSPSIFKTNLWGEIKCFSESAWTLLPVSSWQVRWSSSKTLADSFLMSWQSWPLQWDMWWVKALKYLESISTLRFLNLLLMAPFNWHSKQLCSSHKWKNEQDSKCLHAVFYTGTERIQRVQKLYTLIFL